jgi:hypothetical protein
VNAVATLLALIRYWLGKIAHLKNGQASQAAIAAAASSLDDPQARQ